MNCWREENETGLKVADEPGRMKSILEPNISDEAVLACTNRRDCLPLGLTITVFAENAASEKKKWREVFWVRELKRLRDGLQADIGSCTQDTMYETKVIVNAAGV